MAAVKLLVSHHKMHTTPLAITLQDVDHTTECLSHQRCILHPRMSITLQDEHHTTGCLSHHRMFITPQNTLHYIMKPPPPVQFSSFIEVYTSEGYLQTDHINVNLAEEIAPECSPNKADKVSVLRHRPTPVTVVLICWRHHRPTHLLQLAHAHMHMQAHASTHTYTNMCVHKHAHVCTHTRTHTHTHARTHAHTCSNTYTPTHIYTNAHKHVHVCVCTHTHTHTHPPDPEVTSSKQQSPVKLLSWLQDTRTHKLWTDTIWLSKKCILQQTHTSIPPLN